MNAFTFTGDDAIDFAFEDDCSRDMGDLEHLVFGGGESSDMSSCLDSDVAKHRGCAFESDLFAGAFDGGMSALDAPPMSLGDVMPHPTKLAHKNTTPIEFQPAPYAPKLTDQAGFVSRDRVFCTGVDVARVAQILRAQCVAHDCTVDDNGKQLQFNATHFSRAFLSLDFEVRVWNVTDASLCRSLLPQCPAQSAYVIEFQKLSGDAFRWQEFYTQLAGSLVGAADCFFQPTSFRPPAPQLDFDMLSDDEEDVAPLDTQPCMDNMVRMMQGSHESQHAAITALVQCCVTKESCDQLVASGFLEVAQTILNQVALFKDDVPAAQVPLLRCILLIISTVVNSSEACRATVTQHASMCQCVSELHFRSPSMFTRELTPLAQLVEGSC